MKSRFRSRSLAVLLALAGFAAVGAQAQQQWHGGGRPGPGPHEQFDGRYGHNHYYMSRGAYVGALPGHPYGVGRYWYSGGIWYASRGPGFIVVGAPIGLFVPVLPPFYNTLWFGGVPYYYANDTYYTWDAGQNGYEVVAPPAGANDPNAAQAQPPASDDLFIYPQNGQSDEQQSTDKYECHKWANSQSGFDPTQSAGGVSPDQWAGKRADYQRAMRACLEGRGYSVR